MGLFWKIMVSFGIAMTVALASTVYVSFRLADSAFDQVNVGGHERIVQEAADALEQGGQRQLRWWLLTNPRPAPGVVLLVIDDNGNELLGRALPVEIARLLMTRPPRPPAGRPQSFQPVQLPRLTGPDGETYRLLFSRAPITVLGILTWPRTQMTVLITSILSAAGMSLLLALYLSLPITRLQRASRALAAGALDTRVGPPYTRRKDEVGKLACDFDTMAERLQQLVNDKETLLRDVSHELRSPLARIHMALALAQRRAGEELQPSLRRIEQESERLNELVGQIMTLSRLRTRAEPIREQFSFEELVGEVLQDARYEQPTAKLEFSVKAPVPQVRGEREALKSAVENVIRNALKYGDTERPIEVSLQSHGDEMVLRVSDRGPGVPENDLKRIFEPFYRGDSSRDHREDSQGIGLAITSRVMELHGGRVAAANREGGGLVVTMTFPADGHRSTSAA
jgi:two-component system, OmpR family, sensor kinase